VRGGACANGWNNHELQKTDGMTEQEFADLLDRHGGDPARWPADVERAAEQLLAQSAAARRALAAARALDGWLATQREHRAPAGVTAAVMAQIGNGNVAAHAGRNDSRDVFDRALDWLGARLWRPVLIGALPAIAGLVIGLASPQSDDADFASQVGSLAFVDLYAEVQDANQP
jgi:hypothetical protein